MFDEKFHAVLDDIRYIEFYRVIYLKKKHTHTHTNLSIFNWKREKEI